MLQIDVTKLVGHDGLRNKFLLSINEKFPEILDCFGIDFFLPYATLKKFVRVNDKTDDCSSVSLIVHLCPVKNSH
jgi:hypothetical protein